MKKIENLLSIPNIITSIRSDDVIVTSLETTLSRTASGKHTTIFCLITLDKKLSYRRETARQLPTWRGRRPPAHSPSAPSGYTYAWSNPKATTFVRQACRP